MHVTKLMNQAIIWVDGTAEITGLTWTEASKGFQLGVKRKKGAYLYFSGFRSQVRSEGTFSDALLCFEKHQIPDWSTSVLLGLSRCFTPSWQLRPPHCDLTSLSGLPTRTKGAARITHPSSPAIYRNPSFTSTKYSLE